MNAISLDEIRLTKLKCISTPGGDVMHALKASETEFNGFGESYFSWIDSGAIKAWKCHRRMTLNLVVPLGSVRFVFHLPHQGDAFRVEEIGKDRYLRLTVPSGIWFGFKGIATERSLLINLADIEHDSDEVLRKPLSSIQYDWNKL